MKRYNPKVIEPKWQAVWEKSKIYQATEDKTKPKRYVLEYFPYPSGAAMHVGHVRNYTIGDAIARYNRMRGDNVLYPMGWDAFGLPAENYAIKTGISPQEAVAKNVENFKQQLMQMGFSYDWSREINSTDPSYYKWTQWFFLLLHKRGLAYQEESLQWWCPFDKTVLANEQVEDGRCWRCGNLVEKKALKQWFFKITDYADRLADDLDNVNWSEAIKAMQRNWIGRSQGAEIDFSIYEKEKKECLVVHGVSGHKRENWFPWLKSTLGSKNWIVKVPNMPTPDHPKIEEWNKTLLGEFEEGAIIAGHSLGAPAALNLLQTANKKADGLILVAPVNPRQDWRHLKLKYPEVNWDAVRKFAEIKFDWEKINRLAGRITIYYSDNDKYISVSSIDFYKKHFPNATFKFLIGKGHFNESSGMTEFPEIIDNIEPKIKVFTTRPDTIYGATFLVLAPEHKILNKLSISKEVKDYIEQAERKSEIDRMETEREKTGVFTGVYAVNPANKEKIPIWVADYVLPGYGTGAIMAVPAHDERDWEFAKKFDLPIVQTFDQKDADPKQAYTGEGIVKNSGKYNGMTTSEMRENVVKDLAKRGQAKEKVNYKIRDWLISRQRYWGAPIPIIHCPKDGAVAVPDKDLPVVLPEIKSYEPSGDGHSPLANAPEFVNVKCPKCSAAAKRETDTMDGFACSSWYFLRFADPHNDKKAFDKTKVDFWLPVDDYIGGAEHAVMHLLYARFWTKVMYDEKLIDFDEPFTTLRNHGMILAPDGKKMSKSWNNTIEPDNLIKQGYGADSIRLLELFIGPWNQSAAWSVEGLGGTYRFLQRTWTLIQEFLDEAKSKKQKAKSIGHNAELETQIMRTVHKTIKKVSQDMQELGFNTSIAALMEYVNNLYKLKSKHNFTLASEAWKDALIALTQLLAPFAPHITEELWAELGQSGSVHVSNWPAWNEELVKEELITIAVQINGKVRAELLLPADVTEEEAIKAAKNDEKVAKNLAGKKVKKAIYVPGRLVSLVI
ncbi:leucine--tRNA ligase [Candidatus Saccharibacteria bacterium]|nr:leucine--tRNA ligase [Candidatus Saccharibacteria bacterium]